GGGGKRRQLPKIVGVQVVHDVDGPCILGMGLRRVCIVPSTPSVAQRGWIFERWIALTAFKHHSSRLWCCFSTCKSFRPNGWMYAMQRATGKEPESLRHTCCYREQSNPLVYRDG
ncbi:unnamed protein product, partial [Ectocarpus sp. 12 AP-2014]